MAPTDETAESLRTSIVLVDGEAEVDVIVDVGRVVSVPTRSATYTVTADINRADKGTGTCR
jgi:hypothetical protein